MVCITDDGDRYVVNPQSGGPEIGRLEIAKQGRIVSAVYTDEYLLAVLFDNGFSFFVEPNHDGYESWHVKWGDELLVAMWKPGLGSQ